MEMDSLERKSEGKGQFSKKDLEGIDGALLDLESLSTMTGFPVDYIKKELLIDQDSLTVGNLRESMVEYLKKTISDLK